MILLSSDCPLSSQYSHLTILFYIKDANFTNEYKKIRRVNKYDI